MELNRKSRLAAGFAAATITAAIAMPGIASANPHHNPHNPHGGGVQSENTHNRGHDNGHKGGGVQAENTGPDCSWEKTWVPLGGGKHGHGGHGKHGKWVPQLVCEEKAAPAPAKVAPAAPAAAAPKAATTTYPVQSQTGSVAAIETTDTGLVIVTLAAAAALGGAAVRRATR